MKEPHMPHPKRTTTLHHRRTRPEVGLTLKALPLAVALCFSPVLRAQVINPNVDGLPQRGRVDYGSVSGALDGSTKLTLTQTSQRAVIDWRSFDIAAGKTVQFVQPNASSVVLNRVASNANMSEIYGTLSANGMVLLMNPNGVLFHQGATVNVASLIVTTGTINQPAFEAGGAFQITGATAGSITNQGNITAANAGLVALVAPSVVNQGVITATGGRIALSGADRATVSLNGGLYEFAVDSGALGSNASVSNSAGARLEGATLLLSTGDAANLVSGVINLEGVQQASSAIVVNGNTVVLKSDLDAPAISGNATTVRVHDTASIQDGVKIAKTGAPGAGATVELQAGTFSEQVALNKANLTLSGVAGAKLVVPDASQVNGITIGANNVTVQGLEIAGPISSPYDTYYATSHPNVSRGIAVGDGITGFVIRNNNIHDVRNGILIHGRNSAGTVGDNRIENTKSGISVQYTDGAGITIAGNSEGAVGNEWGLNLHLNGHLDGSGNILSNSTPIATAPTASWQQSLLNLSTANNGWAVQDQGYTSSNRTRVTVATSVRPATRAAGSRQSTPSKAVLMRWWPAAR
jgi:filamentous hemagglutinin family protein